VQFFEAFSRLADWETAMLGDERPLALRLMDVWERNIRPFSRASK
jgi:hypothetical protein